MPYFFAFALRTDNYWFPWDYVVMMSEIMEVPTVPVLWRGVIESEQQLRRMINEMMMLPSTYGSTKEGVVIRKVDGFDNEDFAKNVAKYVRENHVQTDQHWTRTWKKAELNLSTPSTDK